jgi:hypothetical protein
LGKSAKNSTKLSCLETTGYRVKYSTKLQIGPGRKVYSQVHTVNSNNQTSIYQYSVFSKKIPVIRIFCVSGWLVVPFDPDKCVSTMSFKITPKFEFIIYSGVPANQWASSGVAVVVRKDWKH